MENKSRAVPVATGQWADPSGVKYLQTGVARELVRTVDHAALRQDCELCLALVEPIQPRDFALEFERMSVHYRADGLNAAEARVLREDWLRLAGHVPADLFRLGLDRYISGPNPFRPTVGQVLSLIQREMKYRKILAERAEDCLNVIDSRS